VQVVDFNCYQGGPLAICLVFPHVVNKILKFQMLLAFDAKRRRNLKGLISGMCPFLSKRQES
jgi:hypothetical protein